MDLTRRDGHAIGKSALVLGAAAIVSAMVNSGHGGVVVSSAITAIASFGGAYWLLTRLYLNDPDARREYQEEMRSMALSCMLKRFSHIENLISILTPISDGERHADSPKDFIASKLYAELGVSVGADLASLRLSRAASTFTGGELSDLESHNFISHDALRAMFLNDVRVAITLSDLCDSFRGASSFTAVAESLRHCGIMLKSDIQGLVAAEFPWASHGRIDANGAVTSDATSVIQRVVSAYKVLLSVFGYTTDEISDLIEHCPSVRASDLLTCLNAGLDVLVKDGITSIAFRDLLLSQTNVDLDHQLWDLDSRYGVRYLLGLAASPSSLAKGRALIDFHEMHAADLLSETSKILELNASTRVVSETEKRKAIVSPKGLRRIFTSAIPVQANFGTYLNQKLTPKTNLAAFLLYWQDLLVVVPEVVQPSTSGPLQQAYARVQEAALPVQSILKEIKSLPQNEECASKLAVLRNELREKKNAFALECFKIHTDIAPIIAEKANGPSSGNVNINCSQQ